MRGSSGSLKRLREACLDFLSTRLEVVEGTQPESARQHNAAMLDLMFETPDARGGSVCRVTAATIAEGFRSNELIEYLTTQMHREDLIYRRRFMCVYRKCGKLSTTIRVMGFLGNRLGIIDADELRANLVDIHGEGPWPTDEEDVFSWTNNGFGDYARSDIDIFVCAKDEHEGDAKVRYIYERICAVDGEDCAAIRTPNTVREVSIER